VIVISLQGPNAQAALGIFLFRYVTDCLMARPERSCIEWEYPGVGSHMRK
jgi:hypothetical protein